MSNTMSHPQHDPAHDTPPGEGPRQSVNPLLWVLLLVALLALGWHFLGKREAAPALPMDPATPIGQVETTPPADTATARTEREPRTPARPAQPSNRDVSALTQVEPQYPAIALRSSVEGTVLVRAEVDASGKPTNVSVAKRSGSRDLDRSAVNAVKQWTFEPQIRDGKAVASTVNVPVDFVLDQQASN